MARRNPNGYGCVTKLSGKRSRPWVIKVTVYDAEGHHKQVPVDYAATEEEANIILAKYNDNPWNIDRNKVTLLELYRRWAEVKCPSLSKANQGVLKSAFRHFRDCYGMIYRNIRTYHMQAIINNCQKSYAVQRNIKALWGHLDNFAYECDIIDKMYSITTTSAPAPETSRTPFTNKQIDDLWKIQDEPWVDTVLIYIYTGFRLNELLSMHTDQVNMVEKYFQGGSKTNAGKGRIVPIHPRIEPLVVSRIQQGNKFLISHDGTQTKQSIYYAEWKTIMKKINADGKTPHEARHTFETNLDNAGGNRKCIDMLMGHKSNDIGNRVYNHKTLEQLRETINLLK